ncbi:hypothetical protein DSL72_003836 [Monilinia vaccinii-corymbosi]|uniref:Zona occludens toxin N-terminal domain-containing protein n=1 Tax=Monilinia vaccinii-corymbosi TaxID=61207 RepID=A0A8A3NXU5_9HELO|nr:hypothetical protein DSL72_003836 [Monilinia vaccinii-corymbosi]
MNNDAIDLLGQQFNFAFMVEHPKSNIPKKVPKSTIQREQETIDEAEYALHMKLLKGAADGNRDNQATTPIFTAPLRDQIAQYGLIGGQSHILANGKGREDPRLFYNIAAPFSTFICGSQGSGKSHTLSCFLENCLVKSHVSKVKNPLSALLFHYDGFIGDEIGNPCEAAYLASNPNINVRVLCSPTNYQAITRTYSGMNVQVKPLSIDQTDLTTQRMFGLMAVNTKDEMPLYLHSINRVLRDLRMANQATTQRPFHYGEFKQHIDALRLTPAQESPLTQRLDTLESFMPVDQRKAGSPRPKKRGSGTDWTIRVNIPTMRRYIECTANIPKAGELTIVDLSCPCVTTESASSLFNLCLSLFLEEKSDIGKVVALDEAHKYMSTSTEDALTNKLLHTIRLQRHLGTRVFISTQEPTINPALIDLCSMTIVHRFSSPEWLRVLRRHLAALDNSESSSEEDDDFTKGAVFNEIVKLQVGEGLLFAPEAIIDTGVDGYLVEKREMFESNHEENVQQQALQKLGTRYIKMKVRNRLTDDGGRSVLAA